MMKTLRFCVAAIALSSAGCSTGNTNNLINLAKALHEDGCQVTINTSAAAPGTAQFQGSVNCPGSSPASTQPPAPSSSPAAPSATFLKP